MKVIVRSSPGGGGDKWTCWDFGVEEKHLRDVLEETGPVDSDSEEIRCEADELYDMDLRGKEVC